MRAAFSIVAVVVIVVVVVVVVVEEFMAFEEREKVGDGFLCLFFATYITFP